MLERLTDPWVFGIIVAGGMLLIHGLAGLYDQQHVVSRESAVIVRRSRAEQKVVALDTPKTEAVNALVADGWKRKAAVSALASNGWKGYPNVSQMVLNAWKSMPGYRK
jgi:hypothetical protein